MSFSDKSLEEQREILRKFNNHGGDYSKGICDELEGNCPFLESNYICDPDNRQERFEQAQSMLAEIEEKIAKVEE